MARPDRITKLSTAIMRCEEKSKQALAQLDKFSELFYEAIKEVLSALVFKGVKSIEGPKHTKVSGGRKSFSFSWHSCQFVCVPCQGVAFPPPEEALLLGELARTQAGRLVLFAYATGEPESAIVVSDHYVFPDGSWCACGLERTTRGKLHAKEVSRYTLRLLTKLGTQFILVWRSRHEVRLDGGGPSYRKLLQYPVLSSD
jgi:hypothetical protein